MKKFLYCEEKITPPPSPPFPMFSNFSICFFFLLPKLSHLTMLMVEYEVNKEDGERYDAEFEEEEEIPSKEFLRLCLGVWRGAEGRALGDRNIGKN